MPHKGEEIGINTIRVSDYQTLKNAKKAEVNPTPFFSGSSANLEGRRSRTSPDTILSKKKDLIYLKTLEK